MQKKSYNYLCIKKDTNLDTVKNLIKGLNIKDV